MSEVAGEKDYTSKGSVTITNFSFPRKQRSMELETQNIRFSHMMPLLSGLERDKKSLLTLRVKWLWKMLSPLSWPNLKSEMLFLNQKE